MPAYRSASTGAFVTVMLFVVIQFGTTAVVVLSRTKHWSGVVAVCSASIVGLAAGFYYAYRRNRARVQSILDTLGTQRMTSRKRLAGDEAVAADFFAPVRHLQTMANLRDGHVRITWFALSPRGERLFEHEYTTGSGKHTVTHQHTVVAFPSTSSLAAQCVVLVKPRWGQWRLNKKISPVPPAPTGIAELDQRWLLFIQSNNPIGIRPELATLLADSPRGETWIMTQGYICCLFPGILDGRSITVFHERAARIAAVLAT